MLLHVPYELLFAPGGTAYVVAINAASGRGCCQVSARWYAWTELVDHRLSDKM